MAHEQHDHPHDAEHPHTHPAGEAHTHPPDQPHTHGTPGIVHQHDEGEPHWHDEFGMDHHGEMLSPEEMEAMGLAIWKLENVELTTVGVDVGSSTSHLMFSRVHLQRIGEGLSTRFVVVGRETLWRSPILLTPYRADDTINAEALGEFIHEAYRVAGVSRSDVDSGAIILTGEALKRTNARAIADLFAEESGKFVCASAGHNLEALLAAHGSGTVGLSRRQGQTLLNVDIGGGTCKFALVRNGEVLHTAAVAVGGRLLVRGERGELVRIEEPARQAARAAGVELVFGQPLSPEDDKKLVRSWGDVLVSIIRQEAPTGLAAELMLTEELPRDVKPDALTFSGGVSEYMYWREQTDYNDFGRALANELRIALSDGRVSLPVLDPGQGIRATVIGASQFTVQVSGNTITVTDETILPLHNLPVLYPRLELGDQVSAEVVAARIRESAGRLDLEEGEEPVALGFRWQGDPLYPRLRGLAEGIRQGMPRSMQRGLPVVLLTDRDVGKTLGSILKQDLGVRGEVVSIDGVVLKEFDFVDIGEVIHPTGVVPVVIKSLLFAGAGDRPRAAASTPS